MFFTTRTKRIFLILFSMSLVGWFVTEVYARSTGINGYTSKNSPGCECHNQHSNTATVLSAISQSGSFTFAPGDSAIFTIKVTNPNNSYVGIDIGVKTTLTGETDAGTLYPITGLKRYFTELVHNNRQTMQQHSFNFVFSWKVPSSPGKYYLRAIANAVNGNGSEDTGDQWNWMDPIEITVTSPGITFDKQELNFLETKVNESGNGSISLINSFTTNIQVDSIVIVGTDASSFEIMTQENSFTLMPNSNKAIEVSFNPSHEGTYNAELQVYTGGSLTPKTLPITASAIPTSVFDTIKGIKFTKAYPNPVINGAVNLEIGLDAPKYLSFELFNNLGESAMNISQQLYPAGESTVSFNLSNSRIIPGSYNLLISDGINSNIIKLIIE